jgi:predicted dithiol-disulfide oxidoreductase (DUF899 family)
VSPGEWSQAAAERVPREYRAARADPLAAEREALWHLIDLTPAGRGDDPDFPH